MVIEAVVLSIIVGLFRGGRLSKFRQIRDKSLLFLIVGILIQSFIIYSNGFIEYDGLNRILTYSKEIILFSFILIAIGTIMNYKSKPLWISFIGYLMNFFVMFSNAWKKPVLMEGLTLAGRGDWVNLINQKTISIFTPLVDGTKYPILGNIIVFAKPYPIGKVLSIGDIIVGIGIFIFIQDIMFRSTSFLRR